MTNAISTDLLNQAATSYKEMSIKELTKLYNMLGQFDADTNPIKKFRDKVVALKRVAGLIDKLRGNGAAPVEEAPEPVAEAPKPRRRGKGTDIPVASRIVPARAGTVQAAMIDILWDGDTIENIIERINAFRGDKKPLSRAVVQSWVSHTAHEKGYGITRSEDGVIQLVLPENLDAPLPHTPRKS